MLNDELFNVMFHPFLMMWAGQALHMLKKLRELETTGRIISPRSYFKDHPYAVLFSVLAGFIVYGFLHTANQLTVTGAFTAGYMADSMVAAFTNRELKKVEKQEKEE